LQGLGFPAIPALDEVALAEVNGQPVYLIGQPGLSGVGYRLLLPVTIHAAIEEALLHLGAAHLSTESYHILRVEAGLPAAGAELTEAFTPLEVGLEAAVSGRRAATPVRKCSPAR